MVIVFVLAAYFHIESRNKIRIIEKNSVITTGEIINHRTKGANSQYLIKYFYIVDNQTYTKEINYTTKFVTCYRTRDCIGKRFAVYYDRNNPENAIIDFENEK